MSGMIGLRRSLVSYFMDTTLEPGLISGAGLWPARLPREPVALKRMQIMEPNQVNILAFTMPGDLQQIGDAEKTDSLANSGVISADSICSTVSILISPSSMRYRAPTFTWGLVQNRMLQVISPRRTASRRRFVNTMPKAYTPEHAPPAQRPLSATKTLLPERSSREYRIQRASATPIP